MNNMVTFVQDYPLTNSSTELTMNNMVTFVHDYHLTNSISDCLRTRLATTEEEKMGRPYREGDGRKGNLPLQLRRLSLVSLSPIIPVYKSGDVTHFYLNSPCHLALKVEKDWVSCINLVEVHSNGFNTVDKDLYLNKLVNDSFLSPMFDVVDVGVWTNSNMESVSLIEAVRYTIPDCATPSSEPLNISFHIMANVLTRQAWEFPHVRSSFNSWIENGAPVDLALFLSQHISERYSSIYLGGHAAIYPEYCPTSVVGAVLMHGKDVVTEGLLPLRCYYRNRSRIDPLISDAFGGRVPVEDRFCYAIKKALDSDTELDKWVLPFIHSVPTDYGETKKINRSKFIDRLVDICCEEYTKTTKQEV